jgi:hypothetical protein
MNKWRSTALMVVLGLAACTTGNDGDAVKLTGVDDGKNVSVPVGNTVEITLTIVGPGQFGEPESSSTALRFEGTHDAPTQVPAGPTQIFAFRCQNEGSATIKIPRTGGLPGSDAGDQSFTVMIQCG